MSNNDFREKVRSCLKHLKSEEAKDPPGERFCELDDSSIGVYSPYESHDGDVGWTVQLFDKGDDVGDMGKIIGEFETMGDAVLFAFAKRAFMAEAAVA